jgi:hypothetical protein
MAEKKAACSCSAEVKELQKATNALIKQVSNIMNCLSEMTLLTGTGGRILEKYGVERYIMTADDKKGRLMGGKS